MRQATTPGLAASSTNLRKTHPQFAEVLHADAAGLAA
jgi:hypothetical protein